MAAWRSTAFNLSGVDQPVRVEAQEVSAGCFELLGVRLAAGRSFGRGDERPGAPLVAILAHRLWVDRFAASPRALGRTLLFDGEPATIVGVLGPEEVGPDVLVPLRLDTVGADRSARSLFVLGRLGPGVSLGQAGAEMVAIAARLEREFPDTHRGWTVNVRPLAEEFIGPGARLAFAILAGAVGAVLLVGCANIANLMLARGLARRRELAVRTALGASRGRLCLQVLTESFVVAAAGALLGLVLAEAGLRWLEWMLPPDSSLMSLHIDWPVLLFALALSVFCSLFFGLVPALDAARVEVASGLHEGSPRAFGSRRARTLRWSLVAGEVALSALLLVVAGLLGRTLIALERVEPGFDPRGLLTGRLSLPERAYGRGPAAAAFVRDVLERLASDPRVRSASAASRVPAAGSRFNPNRSLAIEGRRNVPGTRTALAADLTVTPRHFATLGIPILEGRDFSDSDGARAPLVAIVSRTAVDRYWPGRSPLGARIRLGDEPSPSAWRTIVGVVGDVRNDDIDAPPLPHVYVPHRQRPEAAMTVVLRTQGDPLALVGALRAAVAAADPHQALFDVKTMERIFDEDLAGSRVLIQVMQFFAICALLLAAVGIYGVVAHAVARRTQEIGLRMALGASARSVAGLVLRQGLTPVGAGLVLGVAGALAISRVVASVLYQVSPTDPLTYVGVAALLALVATAACLVPARRAARVDPLEALRTE